ERAPCARALDEELGGCLREVDAEQCARVAGSIDQRQRRFGATALAQGGERLHQRADRPLVRTRAEAMQGHACRAELAVLAVGEARDAVGAPRVGRAERLDAEHRTLDRAQAARFAGALRAVDPALPAQAQAGCAELARLEPALQGEPRRAR